MGAFADRGERNSSLLSLKASHYSHCSLLVRFRYLYPCLFYSFKFLMLMTYNHFSSFKANATCISTLMRDSNQSSSTESCWLDWICSQAWIGGARHLRPQRQSLYWYQVYLLDVNCRGESRSSNFMTAPHSLCGNYGLTRTNRTVIPRHACVYAERVVTRIDTLKSGCTS